MKCLEIFEKLATITIDNNIYSYLEASNADMDKVYKELSFLHENYVTKRKYRVSYLNKKTGEFRTGLINKVKQILPDAKIKDKSRPTDEKYQLENLYGFVYRKDQEYLIKKMIHKKRGCLVSLMGTGKTLMMNALMTSIYDKNILCLCNAKDVHEKNFKRSKEFFGNSVYMVKNKRDTDWIGYRIVYASTQIMSNIDPTLYINYFDVILLDEGHHMTKTAEKILDSCNAEYRFAFTATFPSDEQKQMEIISLFGDVIEGERERRLIKRGVLSKIKVSLYSPEIKVCDSFRYQDIYAACIVNNHTRNELIVNNSIKRIKKGLSGLVMTTRIEHGENLRKMFLSKGYDIPFINGSTPIQERKEYERQINEKEILCIITNVWKEGVDIPSLNYVNVAFGEKAEDRLKQIAGRTNRGHKSKEHGEVIDYLDVEAGRYLSGHTVQRLRVYSESGWL